MNWESLNKIIDEELQFEDEIEEATTSSAVAAYSTPMAFSSKRKVDDEKEEENSTNSTGYKIVENTMGRVTVKEIKVWMKTLEENRYKKLVNADCRRVAWFVNNNMSEDYESMPTTLRKKWVKASYGKERYLAKEFIKSKKQQMKEELKLKNIIKKYIKEELRSNNNG
tara:strand:- start:67 stop:570 length:504 start_codon:yes stop_codon:yes gene_type:complete